MGATALAGAGRAATLPAALRESPRQHEAQAPVQHDVLLPASGLLLAPEVGMVADPHRPVVAVPATWDPRLQQALDDAARREHDMLMHLRSQLDGPLVDDVAAAEEWGRCG